ncbi:MAG: 3'-5' exoribonuclease [Sphingobacteriales bacterium]|nr:MAG: 3'-5' exoribonuclease [Sphingobacteriales bacterium]
MVMESQLQNNVISAALELRSKQKAFNLENPLKPGYMGLHQTMLAEERAFDCFLNCLQMAKGNVEMITIPVFEHLMIDIETLGTDSNSVILSLAAVEFDIATGKTGASFYKRVNLQSALDAGLKVSASTIKFWFEQSEAARKDLFAEVEALEDVLVAFTLFANRGDVKRFVWGNSARFDLGILENAYKSFSIRVPWIHWNERDVRTLASLQPETRKEMPFTGTKHNPLDDCFHQIKYCSAIWNSVVNNEKGKSDE